MWRISSLYNPARNRQLSVNTWVHAATKERNVAAYQKTQRLAYYGNNAKPKAKQLLLVSPDNTLSESPADLATKLTAQSTTDSKTKITESPSNTNRVADDDYETFNAAYHYTFGFVAGYFVRCFFY